jgi:hypothetical protein
MPRPMHCRSRARVVTSGVSFPCSSRSCYRASRFVGRRRLLTGPGACSAVAPFRSVTGEHQVSQVPRRALCEHAPLYDPGPVERHRLSCVPLLPSARGTASASGLRSPFSGLNHAAYSLAVYTSRNGSPRPAQHSLPAGHHPLLDRTRTCRLSLKGFRLCSGYLIVFPLSEASWRTPRRGRVRRPAGAPTLLHPLPVVARPGRLPPATLRYASGVTNTHEDRCQTLPRVAALHIGGQPCLPRQNSDSGQRFSVAVPVQNHVARHKPYLPVRHDAGQVVSS